MNELKMLLEIVKTLRSKGGCDWDRSQTEKSLRPYLLEEAYEVIDSIDQGDDAEFQKELGDLLFVVLMLCQIADDRGAFSVSDVARSVGDKMVRRHPHVFIPGHSEPVHWEARKAEERGGEGSALDGVPKSLPALLRAHRVSEKAAEIGFDWPNIEGVREKLVEEERELDEALRSGDADHITEEFGDVLFTLVNMGRHLPTDAETALRIASTRFETRFRRLERHLKDAGTTVHNTDSAELERLWRQMKDRGPC